MRKKYVCYRKKYEIMQCTEFLGNLCNINNRSGQNMKSVFGKTEEEIDGHA